MRGNFDFEENDKTLWDSLNPMAMSDEEYDEKEKMNVLRTLPWRSQIVTDLIRRCDRALGVARVYGEPSERQPDEKCKNFCSDKEQI